MKVPKAKRGMKPPPIESAAIEDYFADIGICVGESTIEGPLPKKKKKPGSGGRLIYKYPGSRKSFDSMISHSIKEMHELLVVGVEFLDLGLVNIEAEHPVPGFDNLFPRLEEQPELLVRSRVP